MSASSRAKVLPLLLRSSLLARHAGETGARTGRSCNSSAAAAAAAGRAAPVRTARYHPSPSRGVGAAAGVRWSSTYGGSSASSEAGESVASSQTSLGSEESVNGTPAFAFAFE